MAGLSVGETVCLKEETKLQLIMADDGHNDDEGIIYRIKYEVLSI